MGSNRQIVWLADARSSAFGSSVWPGRSDFKVLGLKRLGRYWDEASIQPIAQSSQYPSGPIRRTDLAWRLLSIARTAAADVPLAAASRSCHVRTSSARGRFVRAALTRSLIHCV